MKGRKRTRRADTHHPHPRTAKPAAPTAVHVAARELTPLDVSILGLVALLVGCHVLAALVAAGWWTAALTDLLSLAYLLALTARPTWRLLLARLLLLGLVSGVLELATDAAGGDIVHSLSYPSGEPLLWVSPAYMPVSWMLVLTELGYLGWRLRSLAPRISLWLAVAITGAAGAVNITFYEETAYYAGWWRYAPTALTLGHIPAYVLLFEGAVAAALPLITARLSELTWRDVALRGVLVGAWMPLAALLAWLVLGR